ncbi:hypothetical protein BgiBS90_011517 [Biomphalaria glabrata]|nr:hypothetical protein BgiBS90_011517 [Biomphalaria glabrata]
MIRNKMRSMMWNKVDESVLPVEGQIDQSDNIVSQAKGGINLLGKEKLPGQDCGCTNSGDGGAGDWSAVCGCVVGNESDLNGGELIPAKPDVVVDEHYRDASWAYLTDEAEKDLVLETMASCGPTTVSQHVHGKGPLTQRLRTTNLESMVITKT